MRSNRYVKKSTDGGWDVVKEGHVRATAHGATKTDAVQAASQLVREEGGGEVLVLNRSGKVVETNKVRRRSTRVAA